MQVGLNRLVDADLDRHVPECRAFYADRGERRGPASLEELLQARAEYFSAPLPAGVSYSGVRVSMTARLGTARIPFHIDVNAGAPISPDPQQVEPPRILGAPVLVKAYPMVMVHAEKIVTAISRGTANTRWRDFGDIYTLSGRHPVDGDELISSINVVATHRRFDLVPSATMLRDTPTSPSRNSAWRRKRGRDELPERFEWLLARTYAFGDPALDGVGASGTPGQQTG